MRKNYYLCSWSDARGFENRRAIVEVLVDDELHDAEDEEETARRVIIHKLSVGPPHELRVLHAHFIFGPETDYSVKAGTTFERPVMIEGEM